MNWSAFAAIISSLGLLATVITAVFFYGRVTQRVEEIDRDVTRIIPRVDEHDRKIGDLEGWRRWATTGRAQ